METAGTIRFAPTDFEIGTIVQIWTAGMPQPSICFTIVAPQRVSVPQVEVRIIPSIFPSLAISFPITLPNKVARSTGILFPTVT